MSAGGHVQRLPTTVSSSCPQHERAHPQTPPPVLNLTNTLRFQVVAVALAESCLIFMVHVSVCLSSLKAASTTHSSSHTCLLTASGPQAGLSQALLYTSPLQTFL